MSQSDLNAYELRRKAKTRSTGSDPDAFDGPEETICQKIIEECQRRRWYFTRTRPDKRSTSTIGTPDFIIAAPSPMTFWIEVKRKGGKLSEKQNITRHILTALGHRHAVVYSFDEFLRFIDG